jgi:hypothetical protein
MSEPRLYEFFGGPLDGSREAIPASCEWVACRDAPTGDMAMYQVDHEARSAEFVGLSPNPPA